MTTKKKLKQLITDSRKAQGKCANCDETNIRLFEFAHFKREDKTIKSVSQCQNLSKVRDELKKVGGCAYGVIEKKLKRKIKFSSKKKHNLL